MASEGSKIACALACGSALGAAGVIAIGFSQGERYENVENLVMLIAGILLIVTALTLYAYMFMIVHKLRRGKLSGGAHDAGLQAGYKPVELF